MKIVLVIWMIVIFILSNQDKTKSGNLSDKVKKTFGVKRNIRKYAHFIEYMILGIIISTILPLEGCFIKSTIFCFIYASLDEIHQFFVPGRSCTLKDVLIDTTGAIVGIAMILLIKGI